MAGRLLVIAVTTLSFSLIGYLVGERADTWDECGCSWLSWESWSSCTETCGGGRQKRSRKVRKYDTPECGGFEACASNDMGWDYRSCNTNCFNGGTYQDYESKFGGGYCDCRVGNKGSCCEQIVTCGKPATLVNGYTQGSEYTYNHHIRYYCNPKYNLTGSSVRTCDRNGYWTGSTPTCHFVASCESSPCENSSPCTNLLDDYRCNCHTGWAGKNCDTDVQPPVVDSCPKDVFKYETELEVEQQWRTPTITDPFGNPVDVTSNYAGNSSTFPWGDFVVQYSGVKPSNGLRAECKFKISTRPYPCDSLNPPENGIVVCNNWRTEYSSVCMTLCKDGYVFATEASFQWYNCGASGNWLPPVSSTRCVPDTVVSANLDQDVPRLTKCTLSNQKQALGRFYVKKLKVSQFNILCLDYPSACTIDNIEAKC